MKNAMKIVLVGVMALFCVNEAVAGSFRDPRDGKTYKTVKMPDGETWMAENLNYKMEGSVCLGNDASNCNKYGRLYTWEDAQEACPSGWHLPSGNEFETMLNAVGENAPKKLRDKSWKVEKKFCVQYACSYGYGSTIKECRGRGQCNCGQGESICMEYEIKEEGGVACSLCSLPTAACCMASSPAFGLLRSAIAAAPTTCSLIATMRTSTTTIRQV